MTLPLPHQVLFSEFCRHATLTPLHNHGRAAEVFYNQQSLGFVDHHGQEGLRQAHQREVNNALYHNTPDQLPAIVPLPPAKVLGEYPQLADKFPELAHHFPSPGHSQTI